MAPDGANSVQNSKMKSSIQFSSPASRVDGQFSSVQFSERRRVPPFSSKSSVRSVQFTNCSDPAINAEVRLTYISRSLFQRNNTYLIAKMRHQFAHAQ